MKKNVPELNILIFPRFDVIKSASVYNKFILSLHDLHDLIAVAKVSPIPVWNREV